MEPLYVVIIVAFICAVGAIKFFDVMAEVEVIKELDSNEQDDFRRKLKIYTDAEYYRWNVKGNYTIEEYIDCYYTGGLNINYIQTQKLLRYVAELTQGEKDARVSV